MRTMAPPNGLLVEASEKQKRKFRRALFICLIFMVIPLVQRILRKLIGVTKWLDEAAFSMGRQLQRHAQAETRPPQDQTNNRSNL